MVMEGAVGDMIYIMCQLKGNPVLHRQLAYSYPKLFKEQMTTAPPPGARVRRPALTEIALKRQAFLLPPTQSHDRAGFSSWRVSSQWDLQSVF